MSCSMLSGSQHPVLPTAQTPQCRASCQLVGMLPIVAPLITIIAIDPYA